MEDFYTMIVVLCVDDNMGMTFLGKRLSKDRVLRERIREISAEGRLLMNSYSAGQFDSGCDITVSDSFLEDAKDGDFCFVENCDVSPYEEKIEKFIIYKWNRAYPSDFKFVFPLEENGFFEESVFEFEGFSHEKLTETAYVRHP